MPFWTQKSGLTQCPSSGKSPMDFGSTSIPKCNKSFPAYGRLQWAHASAHASVLPNTRQSPMGLGNRSISAHKPLYPQGQDYHKAMSAPVDTDFQLFFIKKTSSISVKTPDLHTSSSSWPDYQRTEDSNGKHTHRSHRLSFPESPDGLAGGGFSQTVFTDWNNFLFQVHRQ